MRSAWWNFWSSPSGPRSGLWLSAVLLSAGFLLGSCSGEPPATRPDPEICDDGIDNDGDGLADCDDKGSCGGVHCQTGGGDTETGEDLPAAEVLYDSNTCCDFVFSSEDCPQMEIGSIGFVNRSESEDAEVDLSCNLIGGSIAAIRWLADGEDQARPFLTDQLVPAGTTLNVASYFVCDGVNQSFTTSCIAHIEIEGIAADEVTFEINGASAE